MPDTGSSSSPAVRDLQEGRAEGARWGHSHDRAPNLPSPANQLVKARGPASPKSRQTMVGQFPASSTRGIAGSSILLAWAELTSHRLIILRLTAKPEEASSGIGPGKASHQRYYDLPILPLRALRERDTAVA